MAVCGDVNEVATEDFGKSLVPLANLTDGWQMFVLQAAMQLMKPRLLSMRWLVSCIGVHLFISAIQLPFSQGC